MIKDDFENTLILIKKSSFDQTEQFQFFLDEKGETIARDGKAGSIALPFPGKIARNSGNPQHCPRACRQHSKSGASLTSAAKKPSYPSFRGERVEWLSIVKSTREFARTQFRFLLVFFFFLLLEGKKCAREFQKRIHSAWAEIVDLNNIGEQGGDISCKKGKK